MSKPGVGVQQQALVRLLEGAVLEAQKWNLLRVIIWNPTSEVEAAAQELARRYGIEVAMVERQTEHLLSFRWRNSDETFAANVLCNEFYVWA
jgi:hypothetical protein